MTKKDRLEKWKNRQRYLEIKKDIDRIVKMIDSTMYQNSTKVKTGKGTRSAGNAPF